MNPEAITETIQTGFRMALGATASLVEGVQDPQKLDSTLRRLTTDLDQLTREWVEKGAITEQEARNLVNSLITGQNPASMPNGDYATITTTATPVPAPDITAELQELTAQIAALRAELERLQNSKA